MQKASIFLCILMMLYLFWPYMALLKLYVGLKFANREIVNEEINWSPFKKKIEENLNHFAKELINRDLKRKNIQISFSSTSLTRKIAEEMATPEGMIFLFHKPNKYLDQIRKIFETGSAPNKLNPPVEKDSLKFEGPNMPNLRKKIDYLFFTDFSHFVASFKIKKISFIIEWERHGFDWKVKTLIFSLASTN
jgi:hypothetical protein